MDSEQGFWTLLLNTQSDATHAVDADNLGNPLADVVCGYQETGGLLAFQCPCHGRAPRDPETNPQMHKSCEGNVCGHPLHAARRLQRAQTTRSRIQSRKLHCTPNQTQAEARADVYIGA